MLRLPNRNNGDYGNSSIVFLGESSGFQKTAGVNDDVCNLKGILKKLESDEKQ